MTTLTEEQIAELRKTAEAATPGPWRPSNVSSDPTASYSVLRGSPTNPLGGQVVRVMRLGNLGLADARFIAAANPATVLALLDDREALRRERDEEKRLAASEGAACGVALARVMDLETELAAAKDRALVEEQHANMAKAEVQGLRSADRVLRADLARVTAELIETRKDAEFQRYAAERARAEQKASSDHDLALMSTIEDALAERTRERDAARKLSPFAKHEPDCNSQRDIGAWSDRVPVCDCGLDAARREAGL